MKIIVTGGAGFIGSHIVDAYISAGHTVLVIDNLSTGFKKNINPKAIFYNVDIRNGKEIKKIFKKEKPEVVNHHAAIAEVIKSLRDPIPTLEVNVIGTANVLSSFGEHGSGKNKKFIFASTGGAIYGNPKTIPASETSPCNPLSPYGLSKLLDEETIKFYARHFGFEYTIFRYANVYGPRQNPKAEAGVVAIFGGLLKEGTCPTIYGDGKKSRDYVYINDVVLASILALKKGKNRIMNIGTGKLTTDLEVFTTVVRTFDSLHNPVYAPHRRGETRKISLDTGLAQKVLGWKHRKTFIEGVRETFNTGESL